MTLMNLICADLILSIYGLQGYNFHPCIQICSLNSLDNADGVLLFQRSADNTMGRRFTVSLVNALPTYPTSHICKQSIT